MLTTEYILAKLQSVKPSLEKKYGVTTMALFGSYSRDDATEESDVDVMVDFGRPIGMGFVHLADELELLLHNKVDLVSLNGIKPKYLKAIEPDLIYV
jgi:predicted nucleotidyltransferase